MDGNGYTPEHKMFIWIRDVLRMSVPFWIIFFAMSIASNFEGILASNAYILGVAIHFAVLHLYWVFLPIYSHKYRTELLYIVILIGNNLIDAIGNYMNPKYGINSYTFGANEYIIGGIVLFLFIRKGYLNWQSWNRYSNG